jgi:hypothetical protein
MMRTIRSHDDVRADLSIQAANRMCDDDDEICSGVK